MGDRESGRAIPPEGIVTIMFTDIVGSTRLRALFVKRFGELAGDQGFRDQLLGPHDERIRRLLAQYGGYEVKTVGDEFVASFLTASNGVACAAAIQRSLHDDPIPTEQGGLRVRIGLHTGQAARVRTEKGYDYDGHAMNVAKRIESLVVSGEQILCSSATRTIAGAAPGIRFHPCGAYLPKGLLEPIEVFEVLWHDRQEPRAPQSASALDLPRVDVDAKTAISLLSRYGFANAVVREEYDWMSLSAIRNGRRFLALILRDPLALTKVLPTAESPLDVIVGIDYVLDFEEFGNPSDNLDRGRFADCICLPDFDQLEKYLSLRSLARLQESTLFDSRFTPEHFEEPTIGKRIADEDGILAMKALFTWLRDASASFLVLLGDYGSGKSFLCRTFARRMGALHEHGQDVCIPLFIDLATVPSPGEPLTVQNILGARLRQLGADETGVPTLVRSIRTGQVAVILDGFDERAIHLNADEQARLLAELRSLISTRARLLLTSRTHLFTAAEERLQVNTHATAMYLLPFDHIRIKGALQKILADAATEAVDLIDSVYNLAQLASRPVLLTMIAGALEPLRKLVAEGRTVGVSDVYEQFVGAWLDRDITKHRIIPRRQRLQHMAALARELWDREARGEQNPGIGGDLLPDWLRARLAPGIDLEAADRQMRTATFLTRDAAGLYRFAHRSLFEYFLACGIADALAELDESVLEIAKPSREIIAFAVDMMRRAKGNAATTIENVLKDDYRQGISENAMRIALVWRHNDSTTAPATASARLDGASLAGENLHGVDWRGAHLSRADLFGADLDDADLAGANLSLADLRSVRAQRAVFDKAHMIEIRMDGSDFDEASFRGATITGASAAGSTFVETDLANATFDQAVLTSTRFLTSRMKGVSLAGADLTRAIFVDERRIQLFGPLERRHEDRLTCVAVAPDGKTVASGSWDQSVRLWDAATGRPLSILRGHSNWVSAVAFASAGTIVISAGSVDKTIRRWNTYTGAPLSIMEPRQGVIWSLAVAPDGETFSSGGSDGTIRQWNARTGWPLEIIWGKTTPLGLAYSPQGHGIACAGSDGSLCFWKISGQLVHKVDGLIGKATSFAFAPDGNVIAALAANGTLRLYELSSGSSVSLDATHGTCLAFAPDGNAVAVGGSDQTVRLWNVFSRKQIGQPIRAGTPRSIVFTRDGSVLVVITEEEVSLWDAALGRRLRTIPMQSADRLSQEPGATTKAQDTRREDIPKKGHSTLFYVDSDHRPWSAYEVGVAKVLGQKFEPIPGSVTD
ncbi:MAG TPA: pentapeptide repeat-containing protein [Thermoanaerobaculia bacterium]|jgi:class 3 adenylate cyclase/uncharacterized protein YjbI with pentapeptide repeats/type II secretory pathway predicted ATPase ExeA